MQAKTERRTAPRHSCEFDASWSFFNQEHVVGGSIRNLSPSGCYLQIDRPIKPGANVMIRVTTPAAGERSMPAPHTNTVAEVKWCRKLNGELKPVYGVGIRYHYPV
jgi:hypothetical protein